MTNRRSKLQQRWAYALAAAALSLAPAAHAQGASSTPTSRGTTATVAYRLKTGETSAYKLKYTGQIDVDYGLLAASMSKMNGASTTGPATSRHERASHDFSATLHWRVIGETAQGWTLSARLQDVDLRVDGQSDARKEMLELPFVIRLDRSGAMTGFTFRSHYPEALAQAIRGLVEPLQVVIGEESSGAWVSHEETNELAFDARYERTAIDTAAGVVRLSKSKTRTAPNASQRGTLSLIGQADTRVKQSDTTIDFSLTGRGVERLETTERIVTMAGRHEISDHSGTFTAVRVSANAARLPITLADAKADLSDASFARARMYDVAPEIAPAVEGREVTAFMGDYDVALKQNTAVGHRLLKNYLRRYPERSLDVARALDGYVGATADTVVGFGFAAFASAGHVEAQRALVQVATETKWKPLAREKALIAMMELEVPETSVLTAVWNLRTNPTGTGPDAAMFQSIATNVYGALGDARKGNAGVTAEVVRTLARHLQVTSDTRQQEFALDALSNVGDFASVTPVAAPYFASTNEAVRTRAFSTFRLMQGETAFQKFADRFAAEKSPAVRFQAARTAADMTDSVARNEWARREVATTRDVETRSVLVQILGRGIATHAENDAALRNLLKNETERRVRKEIYAFISTTGKGGL